MREDRRLGFLESLAISAAAGAVSGGICGAANVSDQNREILTSVAVDLALNEAQIFKQRDRKDHINPGW